MGEVKKATLSDQLCHPRDLLPGIGLHGKIHKAHRFVKAESDTRQGDVNFNNNLYLERVEKYHINSIKPVTLANSLPNSELGLAALVQETQQSRVYTHTTP